MKKINFYIITLILLFAQAVMAQDSELDLAVVYKNMGNLDKAISQYESHYSDLDEFQMYDLGELYLLIGEESKAVKVLESIVNKYPDFQKAYLPLANSLRKNGDYAQAMRYYEVYGNFDPYVSSHYVEAMRWAEGNAMKGVSQRKSIKLNTLGHEGFPIEYQGNMVFASTRMDIKRNIPIPTEGTTQMFTSHLASGNQFSFPSFLLKDLQAWQNMAMIAAHPKTNEVIFTKISNKDIFRSLNSERRGMSLFTGELVNGELKNIKAMPFNSINHNTAAAVYSEDGNTIYFMSDMKGGYGGYDIYTSTRNSVDGWSEPINLGKEINSSGNELFPQVVDGALVFASDWWMGYGGYDLFASRYNPANSRWSKCSNLSLTVNSKMDEFQLAKIKGNYYLTALTDKGNSEIFLLGSNLNIETEPVLVPTSITEERTKTLDEVFVLTSEVVSEEVSNEAVADVMITMDIIDWLSDDQHEFLQDGVKSHPKKIYSVQVAIIEKTSDDQMRYYGDRFKDIDAVYKIYFPDAVKIRVGSYDTHAKASLTLKKIHNRGFKDAFIVEEEIMYSSASSSIKDKDVTVKPKEDIQPIVKPTEKTNDNISPSPTSMAGVKKLPLGDGTYKVRLAAYLEPKWFNSEKASLLGNIQRINKEEWAIYFIGDYASLPEAQFVQAKAIESGFNNAEVVEFRDGEYHKVKH